MQYLKNTTKLHDRKYVMIEQQISPHTMTYNGKDYRSYKLAKAW